MLCGEEGLQEAGVSQTLAPSPCGLQGRHFLDLKQQSRKGGSIPAAPSASSGRLKDCPPAPASHPAREGNEAATQGSWPTASVAVCRGLIGQSQSLPASLLSNPRLGNHWRIQVLWVMEEGTASGSQTHHPLRAPDPDGQGQEEHARAG